MLVCLHNLDAGGGVDVRGEVEGLGLLVQVLLEPNLLGDNSEDSHHGGAVGRQEKMGKENERGV